MGKEGVGDPAKVREDKLHWSLGCIDTDKKRYRQMVLVRR